jgi:hypothetical protein
MDGAHRSSTTVHLNSRAQVEGKVRKPGDAKARLARCARHPRCLRPTGRDRLASLLPGRAPVSQPMRTRTCSSLRLARYFFRRCSCCSACASSARTYVTLHPLPPSLPRIVCGTVKCTKCGAPRTAERVATAPRSVATAPRSVASAPRSVATLPCCAATAPRCIATGRWAHLRQALRSVARMRAQRHRRRMNRQRHRGGLAPAESDAALFGCALLRCAGWPGRRRRSKRSADGRHR